MEFITVNVMGGSIVNTRLNYSSAPLTILSSTLVGMGATAYVVLLRISVM